MSSSLTTGSSLATASLREKLFREIDFAHLDYFATRIFIVTPIGELEVAPKRNNWSMAYGPSVLQVGKPDFAQPYAIVNAQFGVDSGGGGVKRSGIDFCWTFDVAQGDRIYRRVKSHPIQNAIHLLFEAMGVNDRGIAEASKPDNPTGGGVKQSGIKWIFRADGDLQSHKNDLRLCDLKGGIAEFCIRVSPEKAWPTEAELDAILDFYRPHIQCGCKVTTEAPDDEAKKRIAQVRLLIGL